MKAKTLFTTLAILVCHITYAQSGVNDFTFNPGTGANSAVENTAIQSDGKIIISGFFSLYDGTTRNRIARLNSDGSLDTTFNPGMGANSFVYRADIQSNGKIIIAGNFTSYNGTGRNYIARLNSDGSLDTTFNPGTGANATVVTTAIQSNGKIIIAGNFTSYNGTGRNYVARLNSDGTIDTSFNPGTGANNYIITTAIQSDGKFFIGGQFTSYNGTGRNYIARLNADGTIDTTFNPGTGTNNYVWVVSIQNDGRIIIGGNFTSYNGTGRNHIVRLNTDGIPDSTFNQGTGANNYLRAASIQSDGAIIIGGSFTSYNGTARNRIARLNGDGTLDITFNPGVGANNAVTTTAIQSDGKIVIGGFFTSYDGAGRNHVARILVALATDLNHIVQGDDLAIYPNPFSTQTTLEAGKFLEGENLTIYNSFGQEVRQIKRIFGDTVTLLRDNLPAGIYFIHLTKENKTVAVEKLMIAD